MIATNDGVHQILESRALQINMPASSRIFEDDVTPESALPFKERLTAFRARHLGEKLPNILKPARGRLGDILRPLLQIIRLVRPEKEDAFMELVRSLQEDRLMEKSETLEARILKTVLELRGDVVNGVLPVKLITDTFNNGLPEKSQITYQRVGRMLKSMGIQKCKTNQGGAAILWDEKGLCVLGVAYGLHETSETSVTSETPGGEADDSDVSGVSDVLRKAPGGGTTAPTPVPMDSF